MFATINSPVSSTACTNEIESKSNHEKWRVHNPNLLLQNRVIVPSPDIVDVALPKEACFLPKALFLLHRRIEREYYSLPWPPQMQRIVLLTEIHGGRGDIVGAAKAIALMQRICPDLHFDWVLQNVGREYDYASFLTCKDPSKVNIRRASSQPIENASADFIVTGPYQPIDAGHVEDWTQRKIAGPILGFTENGSSLSGFDLEVQELIESTTKETRIDEIYRKIHSFIFPSTTSVAMGHIPMGLRPGSGVFLDRSRIDAPLPNGYCCPSYLLQLQDVKLRQDILRAMHIVDGTSKPDYAQYSLNAGYAHRSTSWEKFIDCVAIHENNKHVVIVLNQEGVFAHFSTEQFQKHIFTSERLDFLKLKGYGTIILKGDGQEVIVCGKQKDSQEKRVLTVIIRPSFAPNDMKCLQLAAERLLATGDNSAVEAWCARCKLFLYEDVRNFTICKWRFLEQQVKVAQDVSPTLSRLLALFGGENTPFNKQQLDEIQQLLKDPNLSDATLQFCHLIVEKYSFAEVLEGALKRAAWLYSIPELTNVETETLDEAFRTGLVTYLRNPKEGTLRVKSLTELGKRIEQTAQAFLKRK